MNWQALTELSPYSIAHAQKQALFQEWLFKLTQHHYQHCIAYQQLIDKLYPQPAQWPPALSASLFKQRLLSSISPTEVMKTLTSSGTSSQGLSKITLDKENIRRQQFVLSQIMQHWLGSKRLPMLIFDHPHIIKNKAQYSARGAGIQGLALFGHHHTYVFDESLQLNIPALTAFVERYQQQPVLLFGFTFMVWQALQQLPQPISLPQGILLHSGGWKKLQHLAVSTTQFNQVCEQQLGLNRVHNFYGMVEQTGTIYVQCEHGHFHTPAWADVIIRDPATLMVNTPGKLGVIELRSLLPTSYPGHCLLTADQGILLGQDDCRCGRLGKYFQVLGRIPMAKVRGCSDVS